MATISNTYTGDGLTTLFSFTFPYISEDDVDVYVGGVELTDADFSFASATQLNLNTAPGVGVAVEIRRDTDVETIPNTFYPGSAIRARDLNDNFTQNLYVIQENDSLVGDANAAAVAAEAAAAQAQTDATAAAAEAATANTNSAQAVTDAAAAQTAASAAQADAAQAAADLVSANAAATAAQADAQSAAFDAAQAATDSATAVSTANTAATDASTALSTANTAATNASTALSTANAASTTATNADTKADTAITDSATALSTANAASAAVSSVVTYTLVANVAAIPASPANGDRVEVTDSTGIESFTPLTGVPVGFVGDNLKAARISYNGAGTTWEWISYVVNDPDARYATISGQAFTGAVSATSFSGPLTGDVTGNVTGDTNGTHTGPVTGDVTGNTAGTHTGPVIGDVTGKADQAGLLEIHSTGFNGSRPIACFGAAATVSPGDHSNIKYAITNPPLIDGNGAITADGGFVGDLTGNADTATDATKLGNRAASGYLRTDGANASTTRQTFSGGLTSSASINGDANINVRGTSSALNFQSADGAFGYAQFYSNGSHFYLDLKNNIGNFYITDNGTTRYTFNDNGNFTASGNVNASANINATGNINASGDISATGDLNGTLGNSQVRSAIALGSDGNLGTYAFLKKVNTGSASSGGTVSGSNLRFTSAAGNSQGTPSGTWKCMGRALDPGDQSAENMSTLWLRIS